MMIYIDVMSTPISDRLPIFDIKETEVKFSLSKLFIQSSNIDFLVKSSKIERKMVIDLINEWPKFKTLDDDDHLSYDKITVLGFINKEFISYIHDKLATVTRYKVGKFPRLILSSDDLQ